MSESALAAYCRLLTRLHSLIRAGEDEGPEGERLRDEMDAIGRDMTDGEIKRANAVSAELAGASHG